MATEHGSHPPAASSSTAIPMVPLRRPPPPAPPNREPLPRARQDIRGGEVTCYDLLRKPTTHGREQRYVSPTTGVCRKLVVQSVNPHGPNERRIKDHTGQVNRLARLLYSMNPFSKDNFFKWVGTWMLFSLKLLLSLIWVFIRIFFSGGSDAYNTGYYKPYIRSFRGQLWAARSPKEYSSRTNDREEQNIPTHSLYPRLLMIRKPSGKWNACTDPDIITHTKFVAISYRAGDMYTNGPNQKREKEEFREDTRAAVVQQNFSAYWLDLECLSENPEEKKLDLYCMADIYRGAEITLIMLNSQKLGGRDGAWKRWGGRVWTFPEALLSQRLYYKFRNEAEIKSVSLHQLANHAYAGYELEQAIINGYSGKDRLDRLERLTLLKSAIWRRGITLPSEAPIPSSVVNHSTINTSNMSGPYTADRVYALMGFFEHRIQPDYSENDLLALARLSMANDNDRIVERMVSLLPTTTSQAARWYADDDVYSVNLWDILPEIQVAGITEQGALVLDGCRAACIRWKDFPEVASYRSPSVRRKLVGFVPYLAWPIMIFGMVLCASIPAAGAALLLCGIGLLFLSPKLFVIREGGRVSTPQPWLIGVKGVLEPGKAATHLYSGDTRCLNCTPSGSEFAVPDQGTIRCGNEVQYNNALAAERGSQAGRTYTLIDTTSFTIYYFCADRPPTVCLYTGREGGLGRFVLCSERCADDELHKETVLRMPTYISQRMELCDWVALG